MSQRILHTTEDVEYPQQLWNSQAWSDNTIQFKKQHCSESSLDSFVNSGSPTPKPQHHHSHHSHYAACMNAKYQPARKKCNANECTPPQTHRKICLQDILFNQHSKSRLLQMIPRPRFTFIANTLKNPNMPAADSHTNTANH